MGKAHALVIFEEVLASIDIPDSSYDTARKRYDDLSEWFGREAARCARYAPHIYSQGSFRLGTVVRPFNADGEYDLDVGCRLRIGITKLTHTQKDLKLLVGADLEDYRTARGIKREREEKRRCWRLQYADSLIFHMDVVPSIPESTSRRGSIREVMVKHGLQDALAEHIAGFAGSITDNRMASYRLVSDDWRSSNSEGYARWFESRMKLATGLLEARALHARAAKIDDLPTYRWKSPLQQCVQLLKFHRDAMFADKPECKPISAILTTLAAEAYQGEVDVVDAVDRVLSGMGGLVRSSEPRVPNPVNPLEDFADKWCEREYAHLKLEENFWTWLTKARVDFEALRNQVDPQTGQIRERFGVTVNTDSLRAKLGKLTGLHF